MKVFQQLFDRAYVKVIQQGRKSYDQGLGCRYRLENLKCAVGHCIDDEHYRTDMEGMGVHRYAIKEALVKSGFDVDTSSTGNLISTPTEIFLNELQTCHDVASSIDFVYTFKMMCKHLAEKYELTIPKG